MAISRSSVSRRSFKPSKTPFRHRPQLGLNFGFDVRPKPAAPVTGGEFGVYSSGGALLGYLVTDGGNPIIFG